MCLLFSFLNPSHEIELKRKFEEEMPELPCSISSEVAPIWREYDRASSTIADAFVKPVVSNYVRQLRSGLSDIDVPAALMVSPIRFRSINTVIPEGRQSWLSLLVIAAVIAAIAVHPQIVLVVMSYAYLMSGLAGVGLTRLRYRRASQAAATGEKTSSVDKQSA